MNVFLERAIDELKNFGLRPLPILHIKLKSWKQPAKPITVKLPLDQQLQDDEKVVILQKADEIDQRENDENITEFTPDEIEDNSVKFLLSFISSIVVP